MQLGLFILFLSSFVDTFKYLLKFTKKPHIRNKDGATLLHMATLPIGEDSNGREGKPEMVKFVLETLKQKPTLADDAGNTVIHWACWYDDPNGPWTVEHWESEPESFGPGRHSVENTEIYSRFF